MRLPPQAAMPIEANCRLCMPHCPCKCTPPSAGGHHEQQRHGDQPFQPRAPLVRGQAVVGVSTRGFRRRSRRVHGPARHRQPQPRAQQRRHQGAQLQHGEREHLMKANPRRQGLHRVGGVSQRRRIVRGEPDCVRGEHEQRDGDCSRHTRQSAPPCECAAAPQCPCDADHRQQCLVLDEHREACRQPGQRPPAQALGLLRGGDHGPGARGHGEHQRDVVVVQMGAQAEGLLQAPQQHREEGQARAYEPARDGPRDEACGGQAGTRQRTGDPRVRAEQPNRGGEQPGRQRRVLVVAPLERLRPDELLGRVREQRRVRDLRGTHPQDLHGDQEPGNEPGRRDPTRGYGQGRPHLTGIGVARSTATAVTLFCGEPSITRSE